MPVPQPSVPAETVAAVQPIVAPVTDESEAPIDWTTPDPSVSRASDDQGAGDGDESGRTESEETSEDTGDAGEGQPQIDYEARFKGLQKTVQQQAEALSRFQAQQQQQAPQIAPEEYAEHQQIAQLALVAQERRRLGALSDAEYQQAQQLLGMATQDLQRRVGLRQQQQALAAREAAMQPLAKQAMIDHFAKQTPGGNTAAFREFVGKGGDPAQVQARVDIWREFQSGQRNQAKAERLEQAATDQRKVAPVRGGGASGGPRLEGTDLMAAAFRRNAGARRG